MSRALRWPIALTAWPMLGLLVVVTGCWSGRPDPGESEPPTVKVATPVVRWIVEWDRYTGRLAALESVDVRARVGGYLQSIHFDEGQIVKAGTVVCVIDQRPFRAAVANAEAGIEQARAQLLRANADVKAATARRQQADVKFKVANRQFERALSLYRSGTITQDVYDEAEGAKLEAEAARAGAEAEVASAKAAVEVAKAAIATAKSQLRSARLDLEYTLVKAPVSGRMGNRGVTEGNLVDEGTVLTTVVSRNPIHCYFDANEQALLKYSRMAMAGSRGSSRNVKNPVHLRLIDEDRYPHLGHMDFVDNRVDRGTGTMRGRAIFPNDDDLLTPGMFAEVRIPGSGRYEAILVPDEAIGTDQSEKFVYVVDDRDVAVRRSVELGSLVDGLRVVRSGLEAGDRVVIGGLQRITPDSPVTPEPSTIEPVPDEDGLPDTADPVPEEEWLSKPPSAVPSAARFDIGTMDDATDGESVDGGSTDDESADDPGAKPQVGSDGELPADPESAKPATASGGDR